MKGKSHRPGLYNCRACDKPFTATIGPSSSVRISRCTMLLAVRLMASSKKGISAHQLYRMLGFGSYRTAWFMAHRIRESMRELHPEDFGPLGGEGKTVEADETYIGGREKNKHRKKRVKGNIGGQGKEIAFALVERGGRVRTQHVPEVSAKTLRPILKAQIDASTFLEPTTPDSTAICTAISAMRRSTTGSANMFVARHTRTRWKATSPLSSADQRNVPPCFAAALEALSVEFDFRHNQRAALKSMILSAPLRCCVAASASG